MNRIEERQPEKPAIFATTGRMVLRSNDIDRSQSFQHAMQTIGEATTRFVRLLLRKFRRTRNYRLYGMLVYLLLPLLAKHRGGLFFTDALQSAGRGRGAEGINFQQIKISRSSPLIRYGEDGVKNGCSSISESKTQNDCILLRCSNTMPVSPDRTNSGLTLIYEIVRGIRLNGSAKTQLVGTKNVNTVKSYNHFTVRERTCPTVNRMVQLKTSTNPVLSGSTDSKPNAKASHPMVSVTATVVHIVNEIREIVRIAQHCNPASSGILSIPGVRKEGKDSDTSGNRKPAVTGTYNSGYYHKKQLNTTGVMYCIPFTSLYPLSHMKVRGNVSAEFCFSNVPAVKNNVIVRTQSAFPSQMTARHILNNVQNVQALFVNAIENPFDHNVSHRAPLWPMRKQFKKLQPEPQSTGIALSPGKPVQYSADQNFLQTTNTVLYRENTIDNNSEYVNNMWPELRLLHKTDHTHNSGESLLQVNTAFTQTSAAKMILGKIENLPQRSFTLQRMGADKLLLKREKSGFAGVSMQIFFRPGVLVRGNILGRKQTQEEIRGKKTVAIRPGVINMGNKNKIFSGNSLFVSQFTDSESATRKSYMTGINRLQEISLDGVSLRKQIIKDGENLSVKQYPQRSASVLPQYTPADLTPLRHNHSGNTDFHGRHKGSKKVNDTGWGGNSTRELQYVKTPSPSPEQEQNTMQTSNRLNQSENETASGGIMAPGSSYNQLMKAINQKPLSPEMKAFTDRVYMLIEKRLLIEAERKGLR